MWLLVSAYLPCDELAAFTHSIVSIAKYFHMHVFVDCS